MGRPKSSVAEITYTPTSLPPNHIIVQLGAPRGASQFGSTDPDAVERLVELSPKLKRSGVLAQRGDFCVVSLYGGGGAGVQGEVVAVWSDRDVKGFKRAGEWPTGFGDEAKPVVVADSPSPSVDSDEDEEPEHLVEGSE